jgi:hypothetical protein
MGHTPLSMHEGHVRLIFPAHLGPYQSYGTLLLWISDAISASLSFSITEPPVQASLACCMESMNYESHPIEYACRLNQTCFSCTCVCTPMIWSTDAAKKCCHIRITVIFHHEPPDQGSLACCMKITHYGSYPIEYACRSCQTCLSCSFVSISMIWNTDAMNKCCHIHITATFHHRAPHSS